MQNEVKTKQPTSLQAQAFVRTFEILTSDKQDEALRQLASLLSNDQRKLLQNTLKPLVNHGVVTDDSRVHYVIVPIPELKPEMIADFINNAYEMADDYFGHSDNMNIMFLNFERAIGLPEGQLPAQSEESKELVRQLTQKDAEILAATGKADIRFTLGLCFKLDPTGIWKPPPEPDLIAKEHQVGMPLALTRYCVDICREGQQSFKNLAEGRYLRLLQHNQTKYHYLDVTIGTQTRRVVYLQPNPTQLGEI